MQYFPLCFLLSLCIYNILSIKCFENVYKQDNTNNLNFKNNIYEDDEKKYYYNPQVVYHLKGDATKEENVDMYDNIQNKMDILHNLNKQYNFGKIKKEYYKDGSNKKYLNNRLKKILSNALNIPQKQINIHDINMLIKMWTNMNSKDKTYSNILNNDENYFKGYIQQHNNFADEKNKITFNDNEKEKAEIHFIDLDYFTQLTN
ncbi:conserved Plasmodium protein, unknown function [Plasmodium sp. gorilla clade G2]|uniref:conserved Plasmodium protein, unknown function n=1 Tax=Plasmodium sp. gorilla clade G2 TaxID=880535 RepID=UPI000D20CBF6|nr:conserved Plasmodium protein, unknown function [Plasmodium sp. gorilla clade G2]SOV10964.1 conserved Plasmodium protein, unknown function [Plasmodium sp. gorilla clade G2]